MNPLSIAAGNFTKRAVFVLQRCGWNPVEQLVVDPMHNILEGVATFHACVAMGLEDARAKLAAKHIPAFLYTWGAIDKHWSKNMTLVIKMIQNFLRYELYKRFSESDNMNGIESTKEYDDTVDGKIRPKSSASQPFTEDILCEKLNNKSITMTALQAVADQLAGTALLRLAKEQEDSAYAPDFETLLKTPAVSEIKHSKNGYFQALANWVSIYFIILPECLFN